MKILIGVPAELNENIGSGFFEAFNQVRKALAGHDVITFAPSGGDVQLVPKPSYENLSNEDTPYENPKIIQAINKDLMSQYDNTLGLSRDFSSKIKHIEADKILAFTNMGLYLGRPYIYYTSNMPYKRIIKIVKDEYPKVGNLARHFEQLLIYYRFVAEHEKENYENASRIILFSHKIRQAIIEEHDIDPDKIIYLPRPIPIFEKVAHDRSENKKDAKDYNDKAASDMKIIIMPAQLRVMKGIRYAIETMKILKKELKNAVLIICGSINKYEEDYIKGLLMDAQGKANIVVTGYLPKKRLYRYMEIADCAFMPFCFDECPIALGECIGHGLPVVTNGYAGYEKSVIDNFGYCAAGNDVHEYAREIIHMLMDEKYNAKKRSGAWSVAKGFNFNRFKKEMNNAIEK